MSSEVTKPCATCPCKPTTPTFHRELVRSLFGTIKESGGFPCHDKHPAAHALHPDAIGLDGKFHTPDCAGYKLWGLTVKENT
jgi:hypothetical protein